MVTLNKGDPINLVSIGGEWWILRDAGLPAMEVFAGTGDIQIMIIVTIRKNETGEAVTFDDYILWRPDDGDEIRTFIWEEGNYSCDCNREIFFEREMGRDLDFEPECCTDGRFSVSLANKFEGRVFYTELEGDK